MKAAFLAKQVGAESNPVGSGCSALGRLNVCPFVEAVFALAQATEAYARARRGGMRGKIVLQVEAREAA